LRRADIISGTVVVLFGLLMIFAVVPVQIASTNEYGLDPKFFPVLLVWLLVAMGALLLASRLLQPAEQTDSGGGLDRWDWTFIVAAAAFLLVGFIAIRLVGFVIAGVGMLVLLMLAIERGRVRWLEVVATAALAPFIIHWLLHNVFSVQLPAGSFFP
jgi:hypothetical protein